MEFKTIKTGHYTYEGEFKDDLLNGYGRKIDDTGVVCEEGSSLRVFW